MFTHTKADTMITRNDTIIEQLLNSLSNGTRYVLAHAVAIVLLATFAVVAYASTIPVDALHTNGCQCQQHADD